MGGRFVDLRQLYNLNSLDFVVRFDFSSLDFICRTKNMLTELVVCGMKIFFFFFFFNK